jgi:hypothetical protein
MPADDTAALRRCVLAVSVLGDLDVEPHATGVILTGIPAFFLDWSQVASVVAGWDPESDPARYRLERALRMAAAILGLGARPEPILAGAARVVALPPGHLDHPGPGWVQERLPGGALDLGIGIRRLLGDPDAVTPLPPTVAAGCGLDPPDWWSDAMHHLERMGGLAAVALAREGPGGAGRRAVLRPVGGCDVLSLLASRALRTHLAAGDGSGMRAVAAPMRSRGWFDLARIDPAFVAAAWTATGEAERGVRRPLLVTADEVALARAGGDPAREAFG